MLKLTSFQGFWTCTINKIPLVTAIINSHLISHDKLYVENLPEIEKMNSPNDWVTNTIVSWGLPPSVLGFQKEKMKRTEEPNQIVSQLPI